MKNNTLDLSKWKTFVSTKEFKYLRADSELLARYFLNKKIIIIVNK